MRNKTNKALSFALSAALMLTNMIGPMKVYADEAAEAAAEVQADEHPADNETELQTEPPVYVLTLPYLEKVSYQVENDRLIHPDMAGTGNGDLYLAYHENEKVTFSFTPGEMIEVNELHLYDGNRAEEPFTIDNERKVSFYMPGKDLTFVAVANRVEPPTELPAVDAVPEESAPTSELPVAEEDPGYDEADGAFMSDEGMAGEAPGEPAYDGETKPAEPAPETTIADEEKSGDTQTPDIELTAEIEDDGLPAQGSIMTVDTLIVPAGSTDFKAETDFTGISFDEALDKVELVSDEVDVNIPGTYSTIYRVSHNNGAKMWYVLRPVAVEDSNTGVETASDTVDDSGENGEEEAQDDASSHPGLEVVTEETPLTQPYSGEALEETTEGAENQEIPVEAYEKTTEQAEGDPEEERGTDDPDTVEDARLYNIFFGTGEGYTISLDNDQVTYQEGDEVSFTVTAKEKYAIKTASAFVALSGEEEPGTADAAEGEDAPILITQEKVEVSRTNQVMDGEETIEASFEFEMPAEDVVLEASMVLAASAANDVTVTLDNGSIKNIPKSWTPDGMNWANGSTVIGYTVYRTVTMPDGKERKAYCMQPSGGAAEDGTYTATEVKKKGKISASEAVTLRKAIFYCYGGPGWSTDIIKNVLSDCSSNDEYYVATHFILSKIYGEATGLPNWNVALSGGQTFTAMNDRGKAQIEAAVKKIQSLPDPDAYISPTQVAGVYNEATGFAETQAVTYTSTVTGNDLSVKLPAGVYLTVGGTTYEPGQKAVIPPGSTFVLKKSGYEAAHQETISLKATIFTDFDAYIINVSSQYQDMGFSYVADKGLELVVNWPDLLTHLNIVKVDAHTGTSTPTSGYSMDGAVYGIYADAGKTQLLEQLTITNGSAVSSDKYVIGRTYYIAEITAPALYQIDTNVYPVMAVSGGTATVTSSDVPKTIKISVQKTDKETGEAKPLTSALSFEGAVFGIYSDAACTVKATDLSGNMVSDIRTDANGHAETPQSLPVGDYYVKELSAPAGYLVNNTVFPVMTDQVRDEIVNQDANAELICEEQVIRANMELMKIKTLKDRKTKAAEGVRFTFTYVNDPSVTFSVVDGLNNTVITDEQGYATTESSKYPNGTLIYGEWEITESNTPEGFESIDPTRYTIAGNGRTYRFVVNNIQICAAVLIEKRDANTGSLIPVAGVKFQLLKDNEPVKLFNPTTRAYEDTWVTDADGMVQLPELVEYGTYVVKEDPESIPDGYFVMSDRSFSVDAMQDDVLKPIVITAEEPPQMGNILVEKRDAKTDEMLEGFTFEITTAEDITDPVGVIRTGTDADGNEVSLKAGTVVDLVTTGKNGNAVSKDLFPGSYTVRESAVANGYAITEETQVVTIRGDTAKARNKENVSEYVLFKNHPTTVRLLKVSSKADEPLGGITFLVHKLLDGETAADYTFTGEEEPANGVIMVNETDEETEGTKEDISLMGAVAEKVSSLFSGPEETLEDEGSTEKTWLSSGLDESLLNKDELFITNENGEITVEYLDADSTYVIREIETIPGYNLSHELVTFDVDSEGLIDGSFIKEVTLKNDPNRVQISKTDITNSEEIPGAQLTITDSKGSVVEEWTSGYEPHMIEALPEGDYVLTEVTAPDGYEETESVSFTVTKSRKIQMVTMKDAPFREVEVSKTDITGDKEIAGAHLTITDKDGNEVESWESTADVHTVKLHSGEYILTETKPSDGYVTAESIPFTVVRTSAADFEVMGVSMKDDVTKTQITKSDITNGEPVIGAELTITDKDGKEVAKWTTTKDPYYIEMLPIGTYTLTEVTAPDGYATAEAITFEVTDTAEIQMVDMKDAPVTVEISKKDIVKGENGKELPGAKLEVRDEGGSVIESWVSEKKPHKIAMLKPGKYTLTEVTAPKGYEVAEKVEFEVKDSGEIQHVVMYDSPKDETVDLKGKKKSTTTGGSSFIPAVSDVANVIAQSVKTGDYNRYMPAILLVIAGAAGLAGVIVGKKKKKANKN